MTLFYLNFPKTQTTISLFKILLGFSLLLGKSKLLCSLCWIGPLLPLQALTDPSLSALQPHWLSFGLTLAVLPSSGGPVHSLSAYSSLSLLPSLWLVLVLGSCCHFLGEAFLSTPTSPHPTLCSGGLISFIALITVAGVHLSVQLLIYFKIF